MTKPKGPITGQAKGALSLSNLKAALNTYYPPQYPAFTPKEWGIPRQYEVDGKLVPETEFQKTLDREAKDIMRAKAIRDYVETLKPETPPEPTLLERLEAELAARPDTVETTD